MAVSEVFKYVDWEVLGCLYQKIFRPETLVSGFLDVMNEAAFL